VLDLSVPFFLFGGNDQVPSTLDDTVLETLASLRALRLLCLPQHGPLSRLAGLPFILPRLLLMWDSIRYMESLFPRGWDGGIDAELAKGRRDDQQRLFNRFSELCTQHGLDLTAFARKIISSTVAGGQHEGPEGPGQ